MSNTSHLSKGYKPLEEPQDVDSDKFTYKNYFEFGVSNKLTFIKFFEQSISEQMLCSHLLTKVLIYFTWFSQVWFGYQFQSYFIALSFARVLCAWIIYRLSFQAQYRYTRFLSIVPLTTITPWGIAMLSAMDWDTWIRDWRMSLQMVFVALETLISFRDMILYCFSDQPYPCHIRKISQNKQILHKYPVYASMYTQYPSVWNYVFWDGAFVWPTHSLLPFTRTNPMKSFGTTGTSVQFYYNDLEQASTFYETTIGLEKVFHGDHKRIFKTGIQSYITLVANGYGDHTTNEPKTTAIALVTNDVVGWWNYFKENKVPINMRTKDFNIKTGAPHASFVAVDTEGYYLEFEQFFEHKQNNLFNKQLNKLPVVATKHSTNLGFVASIVWFYYRDLLKSQQYYEKTIGTSLIVDQSWAQIHSIGMSGYIGIVDEKEGMKKYTTNKSVDLVLKTSKLDQWFRYFDSLKTHPKKYVDHENGPHFIVLDNGGYTLRFEA